ncbi:MAG: nucleotidyltransferase domain-containing protein [Nanoarchaeota archaeon]|nr:nucleotidyltransferase domain-containing protein [Nanoarchaeota archaeon]
MDNKQKIINFLGKNFDKFYTMHELSKLLKIPYATFYRTVQEINDLLIITVVGKSKTMQLNLTNSITKAHLIVSSDEEKKEFLQNQPIIKKIEKELDTKEIVVLFGSYAKRIHHEKSDIDLLIINKEGSKSISFSKY